jgi:alpha/beta superfamily hydrolase
MEETVCFRSGDIALEGLVQSGSKDRGAVITHPHPLYGGDMNNHVVAIIQQAYRKKGYTTLRFNFRGTGSSQGRYDNGIGEQNDIAAAVSFLRERGHKKIALAGYSFGVWINALAIQNRGWTWPMVWVSPPVEFIDFSTIGALPGLELVVTGSRDDISPAETVRRMLPTWNPAADFEIIAGSDHFYSRHARPLEDVLGRHI